MTQWVILVRTVDADLSLVEKVVGPFNEWHKAHRYAVENFKTDWFVHRLVSPVEIFPFPSAAAMRA